MTKTGLQHGQWWDYDEEEGGARADAAASHLLVRMGYTLELQEEAIISDGKSVVTPVLFRWRGPAE